MHLQVLSTVVISKYFYSNLSYIKIFAWSNSFKIFGAYEEITNAI